MAFEQSFTLAGRALDRVYRYCNGACDAVIAVPTGQTGTHRASLVDSSNGDLTLGRHDSRQGITITVTVLGIAAAIARPASTESQGVAVDPDNGDIVLVGGNAEQDRPLQQTVL